MPDSTINEKDAPEGYKAVVPKTYGGATMPSCEGCAFIKDSYCVNSQIGVIGCTPRGRKDGEAVIFVKDTK